MMVEEGMETAPRPFQDLRDSDENLARLSELSAESGARAQILRLLAALYAGVLIVCSWRGSWHLLDEFEVTAAESFLAGLAITLLHFGLHTFLRRRLVLLPKAGLCWCLLELCYAHICLFGVVAYWRGVWYALNTAEEKWNQDPVRWAAFNILMGAVLLSPLRLFRSSIAPPLLYAHDKPDFIPLPETLPLFCRHRHCRDNAAELPAVLASRNPESGAQALALEIPTKPPAHPNSTASSGSY